MNTWDPNTRLRILRLLRSSLSLFFHPRSLASPFGIVWCGEYDIGDVHVCVFPDDGMWFSAFPVDGAG